jgi:hypothetical protein
MDITSDITMLRDPHAKFQEIEDADQDMAIKFAKEDYIAQDGLGVEVLTLTDIELK